jgi:succinate-acetate transporter protein
MSESRVTPTQPGTVTSEQLAAARAPLAEPGIADPAPLGLAGLAMTTMVLSVFNAGILPARLGPTVLGLALFYGGGAQLLAGMWEFRKGNTFGAVAFTSLGAFYLSYWFYASFVIARLPLTEIHQASGVFLLGWTIFVAYMTVASLRVSGAVAAVFVLLTLSLLFLTLGAFGSVVPSTSAMTKVGGWLGLAMALAAWYASFAGVTNATYKRTVVPTWPLLTTAGRA